MRWLFTFSVLILCVFVFIAYVSKLRFNLYSDSLPRGIYREINSVPEKGRFATTLLPKPIADHGVERDYLPSLNKDNLQPALKIIIGVPGDHISLRNQMLVINGILQPTYRLLTRDSKGRPMKRFWNGPYTVPRDRFLLLSDYKPNSWDSRYWGPVKIKSLLAPVILFE